MNDKMLHCSLDDISTIETCPRFYENIDYTSPGNGVNAYSMYQCWKQNRKPNCEDISAIIPSSISKRLENICWRRWGKDMYKLGEIPPWTIDWSKNQDITWLYGPKFEGKTGFDIFTKSSLTETNLSRINSTDSAKSDDDLSSSINSSDSLMSYSGSTYSMCSVDSHESASHLTSALKKSKWGKKKRSVRFNHIINSREYFNGRAIDYGYLDHGCL